MVRLVVKIVDIEKGIAEALYASQELEFAGDQK